MYWEASCCEKGTALSSEVLLNSILLLQVPSFPMVSPDRELAGAILAELKNNVSLWFGLNKDRIVDLNVDCCYFQNIKQT